MIKVQYLNTLGGSPRIYGAAYDSEEMLLEAIDVPLSFQIPMEMTKGLEADEVEALLKAVFAETVLELEKAILVLRVHKGKP